MAIKKPVTVIAAVFGLLLLGWWIVSGLSFGARSSSPPPPEFVLYAKQPEPAIAGSLRTGNWDGPQALASVGNRLFVLDSGNDRILELDESGKVAAVLCETGDCQFLLKNARSMTSYNGALYVANTLAGQVVVLSPSGSVIETITIMVPGAASTEQFSPAGIAVSKQGDVYVTDLKRSLLVRSSGSDRVWSIVLDAWNDSPKYRSVGPMGLAIDGHDNLYVANSGDGTIRMYSPQGRHLQEFSMRSNPAFFSPAYIAVDPSGNVYFTDNRSRMIFVYRPTGELAGEVGLLDSRRVDSPSVLRDPQGIHWHDGTLYVADGTSGVFGFQIDPAYWDSSKPRSWSLSHP